MRALRLDVINSIRGGDRSFQWRRDKSAHQFGIGPDVNRIHGDRGDVAARILPNVEGLHRLQSGNQDHEADHHRQHRASNEKIGKRFHLIAVALPIYL